jgi:hypothetical protein
MGLASLLRHVGIHTPNGVTVDGIPWLIGRAQALRFDADHCDQKTIGEESAKARESLADKARAYRQCALELDNLASELGAA